MKISFKNFRCHREREVEFPDQGLVLLTGDSGNGKTSVLRAIQYCWYDSVKKPYTFGQKTCAVTVDIPGLTVMRQKGPARLQVKGKEDQEAQDLIQSFLGMNEAEFMASSYIQQKMQSSLLTLSPADQLAFVEKLAFGDNSPEKFKTAIQAMVQERKKNTEAAASRLQMVQTMRDNAAQALDTLCQSVPSDWTYDAEPFARIEERERYLRQERDDALNAFQALTREESDPRYRLDSERDAAAALFASLKSSEADRKEDLQRQLDAIGTIWPNETKEEAQLTLQVLSALPEHVRLTQNIAQDIRLYDETSKKAKSVRADLEMQLANMPPVQDANAITEEIQKWEALKGWIIERDRLLQHTDSLASKYTPCWMPAGLKGTAKFQAIIDHIEKDQETLANHLQLIDQDLATVQLDIRLAQQQSEPMECPSCHQTLFVRDRQLHTSGEQKSLLKLQETQILLKKDREHLAANLKLAEQSLTQARQCKDSIKNFAARPFAGANTLAECESALLALQERQASVHSTEAKRQSLKERMSFLPEEMLAQRVKQEIERKTQELNDLSSSYPEFANYQGFTLQQIDELKVKTESYIRINQEKEVKAKSLTSDLHSEPKALGDARRNLARLEAEVQNLQGKLRPLADIRAEQQACKLKAQVASQELSDMDLALQQVRQSKAILQKVTESRVRIESLQEQVSSLDAELASLAREEKEMQAAHEAAVELKQLSESAQMEAVASVLESINIAAKDFLDILFPDDPCSVALLPYKQNKDAAIRSKFSTLIRYKGCEYQDIEEISGGEYDRIVLAYQLALNSIYCSPILMLDEAFTGVQPELFNLAMDALRQLAQKKLIIVISHGANHGVFDHVVEV